MNIVIGNDHGGLQLKESIVNHLKNQGFNIEDIGTDSPTSVDYPIYAKQVCDKVNLGKGTLGILCCGTGIGMSIAANKQEGIRASVVTDTFSAQATREHNNSNVLCLGQRVIGEGLALKIVDTWLGSEYQGGRHDKRIKLFENKF